jgi:glutathione synthase/RimK-type ligase-like ATP-grasp enzyme
LKDQPTIVSDNRTLFATYQQLKKDDIIVGRLRLKPGEEHLLTDLLARGIHMIPSATAQLASRSKVFQVRIFSNYLPQDTLAIYDAQTLLQVSSLYLERGHQRVVLKHDRKNGGLGVHIFTSIEDLYNQVSVAAYPFPFIIQPFQAECRDIRVIIIGDYIEAYQRRNPFNFRQNLHCGGVATPYRLSDRQLAFCHEVMDRGAFPYAHLDLLLTPNDGICLMEINLRGGLRGAKMSGQEYQERIAAVHRKALEDLNPHN